MRRIISYLADQGLRVALAVVLGGALLAASILIAFRWQISAAPGRVYRLDGWTGHVTVCDIGVHDYLCQPIEFEK